jgi:hypothetical protein
MTPREGLLFFLILFKELCQFGTRMKWWRPKTPRRSQAVRPERSKFYEEMMRSGSKNDVFKKIRKFSYIPLKCKPTPVLAKSVGGCAKSKIYLWRLPQWNKSWYVYLRWSTIYVGCWAQLLISLFGRPHKKPDFGTPKMEKALFVGWNENQPPWRSSPSQGPHACPI